MVNNIDAKELPLQKVFDGTFSFEVPNYQRPYAWTVEQTEELLDDIQAAMNKQQSPYFLGSIVIFKENNDTRSRIIDGQQRLTTLTILFCILRELTQKTINREGLDEFIWTKGNPVTGREDHYRLRARDQEFFRKYIQAESALKSFTNIQNTKNFTDSQMRMYENVNYLWKNLKKEPESKREKLGTFLMTNCYLVVVSTTDRKSAYRIFSVLNTRGIDLSATDILKAEIIGELPESERDEYAMRWEHIEERLGRDEFNELFMHIRMIHVKAKAQEALEDEFREGVLSKTTLQSFMDDTLDPMERIYQIVSKANYRGGEKEEAINARLEHLGRIDNRNWIPPALAYFDKFKDDENALLQFVRDLERLAYMLFILRESVNARIRRYKDVIVAIENAKNSKRNISALELSDDEKDSVKKALDGPIYTLPKVCKPLLLRLDSLLSDEGVEYKGKVVSVEHVLPQTPEDGSIWLQWFPDEQERLDWTHKLANLVLLSRRKNAKARNYDFRRKKEEYFLKDGTSMFAITHFGLTSTDEWTPHLLHKRQKELIGRLCEEWKL